MSILDKPEYMCECCGNTSFTEFQFDRQTCFCEGAIVPCKICVICGTLYNTEDWWKGYNICEHCFRKGETIENAFKYAEECGCSVPVEINEFVVTLLGEERISQILNDYIIEHYKNDDENVRRFLEADSMAFAWFLEEQDNDKD